MSGKHDLQRGECGDERHKVGDEQGTADGTTTIPGPPEAGRRRP
jgi:hypothetical protein